MSEKLQKAIRNNIGLYEAVLRARSNDWSANETCAYTLSKAPPFYSNIVSHSADWKPDELFHLVCCKYEDELWDKVSIKDAFARRDLAAFGFARLFDAQWMYLTASAFEAAPTFAPSTEFKILSTPGDLADWRRAWDKDVRLGEQIFRDNLLKDETLFFVAGFKSNAIVCGCLVNATDDVLGVSNFFSFDESPAAWARIVRFIHNRIGMADVVCYERGRRETALRSIGFEVVGELTVWLKRRPDTVQI
jgi:hypothetical protein